jgi:dTDP-4-amino-4,6-dideoxygalactose transaminase
MKKIIKLFDPVVNKKEELAIKKTLHSHFWASGAGTNQVQRFEDAFRNYISADSCVALNSGTAALHLALSLLNLKGKEVIIPSLSFVATAHAVILNDAKPVFVDVDPATGCIDATQLEGAITKKTRVILPVHFAGMPCEMEKIMKICKKHDITLVEDAAHAAGAKYKKNKIGTHGTAVCFSFHPVKNLAMPTGGAITLNGRDHSRMKAVLNSMRWCGISDRKGAEYNVDKLGWNYYMNEFSAAVGLEQLKKLDMTNSRRKYVAKRYAAELKTERKMPFISDCSYHFYWICVKNRDRFMKKLQNAGIETGIHYKPIHSMKFYANKKTVLPNTESFGKEIVSIPTHPNLSESDISMIIEKINRYSS